MELLICMLLLPVICIIFVVALVIVYAYAMLIQPYLRNRGGNPKL